MSRRRTKKKKKKKKHHQRVKSVLSSKRQRVKTKTLKVQIPPEHFVCSQFAGWFNRRPACVASLSLGPSWSVCFVIGWFWVSTGRVDIFPFCCYCSVRCSLVSPCLEGWLGDGAWEGCVPEGRVWAMGTPPGTMPSNAPGMPPGATPTTPGGYLGGWRGQRLALVECSAHSFNSSHSQHRETQDSLTSSDTTGSFLPQELFQGTLSTCYSNKSFWWFQNDWGLFFFPTILQAWEKKKKKQ